jgi:hypothetical protein
MPTLRSNRWALVMAPALLIVTGCGGNNESGIDTTGTTTSPDAASTPEEMLKRAAAPAKKAVPAAYPRPSR